LKTLRRYYKEVKTKRQLSLEVPAGFHQSSTLQQNYRPFLPVERSTSIQDDGIFYLPDDTLLDQSHATTNIDTTSPDTNLTSTTIHIPLVHSIDKPSSSLPTRISMSEDYLCACVGFRHIDTIKHHLDNLYLDGIQLNSLSADAILDSGDLATLQKRLVIQHLFLDLHHLVRLCIWILFLVQKYPLEIYITVLFLQTD
jgi:hypothetical protein